MSGRYPAMGQHQMSDKHHLLQTVHLYLYVYIVVVLVNLSRIWTGEKRNVLLFWLQVNLLDWPLGLLLEKPTVPF